MKRNVRYFKKHLDWIISHLFVIAGIVSAAILLCHKQSIMKLISMLLQSTSQITNTFLSDLLILIISLIITWFSSKVKVFRKSIPLLKSRIYTFLLNSYSKAQGGIRRFLIPKVIKIFYSYHRLILSDQQRISDDILNTLSKGTALQSENVFWIIGKGFSGKTSCILNLFSDMITKKQYYALFSKLDGHIEYFDLARDDSSIESIIQGYKRGQYGKSLLVLDNIHKITQDKGIRIVNDMVRDVRAFALIIIMRPLEDFIIQKETIALFSRTINDVGHTPYYLSQIQYEYDVKQQFEDFMERYQLNRFNNNGAVLFHFVKLCIKSKQASKTVCIVTDFLNGKQEEPFGLLIQYIVTSSLFTGSFHIGIIKKELEKKYSANKINQAIRALYQIGFLNSYPNETEKYYFFNEELAKFYFAHTYLRYRGSYQQILKKMSEHYRREEHDYLAYLYSFFLPKHASDQRLFEKVAMNANYKTLLGEVKYLLKLEPGLHEKCHKELGTLYDRCGELHQALQEYKQYYEQCNNFEKPDAFFKIVQMEHSYYWEHVDEAAHYMSCSNAYNRLLAKYWAVHMNMHCGKFQFDEMAFLINELERSENQLISLYPYDALHLIRRAFFDFFRLYYIQYISDYQKLIALNCEKLHSFLKGNLEEFPAYYNKFVYGHYLLYDVLFRLGIWGEYISEDEYSAIFSKIAFMKYQDTKNIKTVIKVASEFYQAAYDFLYKIGDKTYYFVNCRYMELLAASGEYKKPKDFYVEFHRYAQNEKIVYYQACAEIYLFKVDFIHLFDPAVLSSPLLYEEQVKETEAHLERAAKYYQQADSNPQNRYAEIMVDLYDTLFSFFVHKKNSKFLKTRLYKLKEHCTELNYFRELQIITFIESKKFKLSLSDLKAIISYYPIVAQ